MTSSVLDILMDIELPQNRIFSKYIRGLRTGFAPLSTSPLAKCNKSDRKTTPCEMFLLHNGNKYIEMF